MLEERPNRLVLTNVINIELLIKNSEVVVIK